MATQPDKNPEEQPANGVSSGAFGAPSRRDPPVIDGEAKEIGKAAPAAEAAASALSSNGPSRGEPVVDASNADADVRLEDAEKTTPKEGAAAVSPRPRKRRRGLFRYALGASVSLAAVGVAWLVTPDDYGPGDLRTEIVALLPEQAQSALRVAQTSLAPMADALKTAASKIDAPKIDAPKADSRTSDALTTDASQPDASKSASSRPDAPKSDAAPKSDPAKSDQAKADLPKSDPVKPVLALIEPKKPTSPEVAAPATETPKPAASEIVAPKAAEAPATPPQAPSQAIAPPNAPQTASPPSPVATAPSLPASVAVPPTAVIDTATADKLEALAARLDSLQARLDAKPAPLLDESGARLEALTARLAALESKLDQPKSDARAPQSRENAAASASDPSAARAVVAQALVHALGAGAPLEGDIAALHNLGVADDKLADLAPFARTGAPSIAQLTAQWAGLRAKIVTADAAPVSEDLVEKWLAKAQSMVKVHPMGAQPGTSAAAVYSRVDAALRRGDLVEAVKTSDTLPEAAKAIAAEWRAAVARRLKAEAAAHALLSDSIAALGRPKS